MKVYTTESLGTVQHLTPAGFLVCKDVPIARTGHMTYVDAELPKIQAGRDRLIHVTRDDALFEPDAIASFEGAPLTDAHPPDFINPRTWRKHSIGHVQNVRRDADKLIADIVVTDHGAIEEVRTRQRRHISCGYDADYEQQEPGRARQVKIVGNHVALVREGRCGPTCSIGDQAPMSTVWEKLRAAFASRDETLLNTAIVEAGGPSSAAADTSTAAGGVQVHVHTGDRAPGGTTPAAAAAAAGGTAAATTDADFQKKTTDALTAITDGLKGIADRLKLVEEKQAGTSTAATGDGGTAAAIAAGQQQQQQQQAAATVDATTARAAFQVVVSKAETILPGVSVPTMDAAMTGEKVVEQTCEFRRRVLGAALIVSPRKEAIQAVMPKDKSVHTMDCASIETAFDSAYEIARASNNRAGSMSTGGSAATTDARGGRTGPYSAEEINAGNRKQWAAFQPENQTRV